MSNFQMKAKPQNRRQKNKMELMEVCPIIEMLMLALISTTSRMLKIVSSKGYNNTEVNGFCLTN
jgi:hypothetical protein